MKKALIRCALGTLLGGILLLAACVTLSNEEAVELKAQADQAAHNKEVMHEFIRLFEEGNWDETLPKVIARDCVLHYPGRENVVGLDAISADL